MTDAYESDDLTDDLGISGPYEPSAPPQRTYNGWHLPRKQVIRYAQWSSPLKSILQDRTEPPTTVKYLGLPGRDLLDVRQLINEICVPLGSQIMFLGFDRTARAADPDNALLNSAYADLVRSRHVAERSVVSPDNIYLVSDPSSQASLEVQSRAPFDIVNLDFCEPVIGQAHSVFPLLHRLLTIQKTTSDWLLLLTSRVSRKEFAEEPLSKLLVLFNKNRSTCDGFEEAVRGQIDLPTDLNTATSLGVNPKDFFVLASFLTGKWLLHEALKQGYKLKIVSTCGYRVYPGAPTMDMLSLAIRMKPVYRSTGDDVGLVGDDSLDECLEAVRLVTALGKTDDVDEYLRNSERLARFTNESVALIESANHQIDTYLDFLKSHGINVA